MMATEAQCAIVGILKVWLRALLTGFGCYVSKFLFDRKGVSQLVPNIKEDFKEIIFSSHKQSWRCHQLYIPMYRITYIR